MKFSVASLAVLAPLVLAVPSPGANGVAPGLEIIDNGIQQSTDNSADSRRSVRRAVVNNLFVEDLGVKPIKDSADPAAVEKRCTDCVSSCGKEWIFINSNADHTGYNDAVDTFCYHATHSLDNLPTIVPPNSYYSVRIRGGLSLTRGVPAQIDFEVHNKQKGAEHQIRESDCQTFLKKMSATSSSCFGKKNIDTKGGTWQIGKEVISYHALASSST